jgi:hypothetical protein
MAKREIPDFDSMAAFDKALADKKPELAARLGAISAGVTIEEFNEVPATAEPVESRPQGILKIVPPPQPDVAVTRKAKRPTAASVEAPVRRRGVVERASGKELRRLTVYVDLGLAHRLRKHCFEHELNLSEVAARALEVGLETLIGKTR